MNIDKETYFCSTCFHKDVCFNREFMDEDDERAMTFCADYHDEDNIIEWTPNDNHTSMRKARADMLRLEFEHWTSNEALYDFIETVGHELSWRMITRVVHKLERKRSSWNSKQGN